jgi:hypothetical protein
MALMPLSLGLAISPVWFDALEGKFELELPGHWHDGDEDDVLTNIRWSR